MADISKITLPSGSTYNIKDQGARDLIDAMSGYTDFLGVTTTALTDGATTNPITINGSSVTAKKGNIATYGSAEFIFNGTAWQEFGGLSGLGSLAYKNSASGSGTVAVPKTYTTTVTPTTVTKYVASSATGGGSASSSTVKVGDGGTYSGNNTYAPAGTNASSTVSGSCTVTPSGSISTGTGTANYTPAGSISTGTGTANYTPAGSVAAPTISVSTAGSTTTIKNPTSKTVVTDMSVAAAASGTATGELVYCSVSNETLTLSKFIETTGASITTSNVTVKDGDASYTASAPTFTGTGAQLKFTGTGTQLKFTGSSSTGTISGTAAAQTFTGTEVELETEDPVYTSVTMPSFSSQTIATGITSASTTTATTENKTVSVTVS